MIPSSILHTLLDPTTFALSLFFFDLMLIGGLFLLFRAMTRRRATRAGLKALMKQYDDRKAGKES